MANSSLPEYLSALNVIIPNFKKFTSDVEEALRLLAEVRSDEAILPYDTLKKSIEVALETTGTARGLINKSHELLLIIHEELKGL